MVSFKATSTAHMDIDFTLRRESGSIGSLAAADRPPSPQGFLPRSSPPPPPARPPHHHPHTGQRATKTLPRTNSMHRIRETPSYSSLSPCGHPQPCARERSSSSHPSPPSPRAPWRPSHYLCCKSSAELPSCIFPHTAHCLCLWRTVFLRSRQRLATITFPRFDIAVDAVASHATLNQRSD